MQYVVAATRGHSAGANVKFYQSDLNKICGDLNIWDDEMRLNGRNCDLRTNHHALQRSCLMLRG